MPSVAATPIEGKTKLLTALDNTENQMQVVFKDAATAFNAKKKAEFPGKGALNAKISALLFTLLEKNGIETCFVAMGEEANTLIYDALTMIPLEVVVRNKAQGSLVKRFGLQENQPLTPPVVEYFLKTPDDPPITDALMLQMGVVQSERQIELMRQKSFLINDILLAFFESCGIDCVDFKLEFGMNASGHLILGDELSPDNFRLRDKTTGQVLDKDVFRLDLGDLLATYQALYDRLAASPEDLPEISNGTASHSGYEIVSQKQAYTAEIRVESRKGILNPESKTISENIQFMGFDSVVSVNAGKQFTVHIVASSYTEAYNEAKIIAAEILSNPVIEDYTLKLTALGDVNA
ncbi:MAG: phosphoribosylformylglycinamidine synthase subunit PurS [Cyanobacteria bacterium P01_H01_bin.74]